MLHAKRTAGAHKQGNEGQSHRHGQPASISASLGPADQIPVCPCAHSRPGSRGPGWKGSPPGLPRPGPGGGCDLEGYVCTSSPTPGRWDSWLPSTSSAYMLSNRKGPFRCSTKAACGQRHGGLPGQGPALGTGAKGARPSGRQAGEGQAMGPAQVGVQRQKTEGCPARSGRR